MSRSSSTRAAHLRAESATLESAQSRLASLRGARAEADHRLRIAQQEANDLAIQQSQLEDRVQHMQSSVNAARAAYTQEFLNTCPDDLLRCIFEAAFDLPDDKWQTFGDGDYNPTRAALPFALATVCRKWRRVALSFPKLWTYIGIPNPPCPMRVDLLLERSAACTLEIILGGVLEDYRVTKKDDLLTRCMASLARHSHRWRKVEIWLSDNQCTGSAKLLDGLRGPLPALTHFHLLSTAVVEHRPRETHLPFAPRLQQLEIACEGFELADHHPGFPSLVKLRCWSLCPVSQTSRMLSMTQATLQHLEVDALYYVSVFPLVMPHLRYLCLHGIPLFALRPDLGFQAPKLTTLSLNNIPITDELEPFLRHLAPTVTHLELSGTLADKMLETIKHLTSVSHVDFRRPPDVYSRIKDDFFSKFADTVPCIWPKLTSLRIGDSVLVDSSNNEGIVRLVHQRTLGRTERVAALQEVVLSHFDAPSWLIAEVGRLLAQ